MRLILPFLLFFIANVSFSQKHDWVLKNEKEGVKVYYRKTADIYELKLAASLKTSLDGLIQLLSEVEHYPDWGYKVTESRLLQKVSDTEVYYYSKLDFPWPLDDRDIIMHTRMEQDPVTRRVVATSMAMPDYIPAVKGVERIRKATTKWTLVPDPSGWTYVEYYIYSDPGGNLPDWLVNMALDVGPRETIKSIRKFIQLPKYREAKLDYIKK
jgi:hypothetical protein